MTQIICAFYKFVPIDDCPQLQADIRELAEANSILGSVLVAPEGINGTISGERNNVDAFFSLLRSDVRFRDLEVKESAGERAPFHRLKIKLKKEIVTFRQDVDPTQEVGTYVKPDDWNALISDPEVLLIDTRNDYEVAIGTFEGAIDPHTDSFTEFADYVDQKLDPNQHKKIAMFCTGGIRCEKATSYLLQKGFENVYHLQGGILKYLEEVDSDDSLWQGECFVFDHRVSVDHNLERGNYALCYSCIMPLTPADIESEQYELGVSCPHCYDTLTPERALKLRERQKQVTLAQSRGERHIGR